MATRLHKALNVSAEVLKEKGVFDGFIDVDSRFHIDPSLLEKCTIPELIDAHNVFKDRFKNVAILLKHSKKVGDSLWRKAVQKLIFKEKKHINLGYSTVDNPGKGIGPELAKRIASTAKEIIDAGMEDPIIFELMGVLEENIGSDRISDMTVNIIYKNLISYTERVSKELGIKTITFSSKTDKRDLPFYKHKNKKVPIVLIPKEILRSLPVAESWEEIGDVVAYNDSLRQKINSRIGTTWKKLIKKLSKAELKRELLNSPELLKEFIETYKNKKRNSYNFDTDPECHIKWAEYAENAPRNFPKDLSKYTPVTSENIVFLIREICEQFARLIQYNGWVDLLYHPVTKKLLHERVPQALFHGIADSYCKANDLDISREPNAGRGPVDFKISKGYKAKVTVELKFSKSSSLVQNYKNQLATYNKAEGVADDKHSIFLVMVGTAKSKPLREIRNIERAEKSKNNSVPEIITVDIIKRKSASKIRTR